MSKGLKALGRITGTQNLTMYEQNECLKTIEKELKALEIIKNKGVHVGNFKDMLEDWKDISFKDYLNYRVENGYDLQNDYDFVTNTLTQEEYDLLREVLL